MSCPRRLAWGVGEEGRGIASLFDLTPKAEAPEARAGPLAMDRTDNGALSRERDRPLPGRPFQAGSRRRDAGRLEHLHTARGQ